jgi:hypothetical protein
MDQRRFTSKVVHPMAVFRIEKNRNYTTMSNFHLRDKSLSNKAKGLLSMMLSLPDEWDFTTRGLASICKDGVDGITAQLKELEACGYLVRHRLRDDHGRISDVEYIIYEQPHPASPDTEKPDMEKPYPVKPGLETPAQINIDKQIPDKRNPDESSTDSFFSGAGHLAPEAKGNEAKLREIGLYREIIRENIDYDTLYAEMGYDAPRLDELVELMVETVCSTKKVIRVAGTDYPAEVVCSRMLKLDSEHIRFVFSCLKENTTKIRNIKQYLLTTLFNAPTTIENYYSALVQHDLYGEDAHE